MSVSDGAGVRSIQNKKPIHATRTVASAGHNMRPPGNGRATRIPLRNQGVSIHNPNAVGIARRGARAQPSSPDSHRAHSRVRSEEHTTELQSLMRTSYAVFCMKKTNLTQHTKSITP